MQIVFVLFVILFVFVLFTIFVNKGSKPHEKKKIDHEKIKKEKQEEWINDNLIYDPETGAKITLEQAESGVWDLPTDEEKAKYEKEQKVFLNEAGIEVGYLFELLKEMGYKTKKLNNTQIDFLEQSLSLGQYDDWHYSDCFILNNEAIVFCPVVKIKRLHYKEPQLMFWVKAHHASGHYFMEEANASDKLLGSFLNKQDIKIKNKKVLTLTRGFDITNAKKILEKFSGEKGLQVELNNENLLIKTLVLPNREDFERINKLI